MIINCLIIVLIFVILMLNVRFTENFLDLNFSNINDDISNGNKLSMSNQPNLPNPNPSVFQGKKTIIPNLIIQGHGIPLRYEETITEPVKKSIFYFNRRIASPECCPSYYSTNQGCVC